MKDRLVAGIVGCGEITSKATAPSLHEARNIEIGMVMDIREWAAKDLGEKYDVPYTTKLKDILSCQDINFIYIATPHYLHAPIAIEAARAGKHIAVEKPIAINLEQADAMIAECKKKKVTLSVCFVSRYLPQAEKAKELIDKGLIGDIIGVRISSIGHKPTSYWRGGYTGRIKNGWRMFKEKSGGGVLIMNSIHDIDRIRFITGLEAERVYSEYETFLTKVEVEDFINVIIRYTNGAIGIIEASSCIDRPPNGTIRGNTIYGTKGQIIEWNPLYVLTTEDTELGEAGKWHKIELERGGNPRTRFFEEFAEAILSGKTPPITAEDGRKALEIVIAAYESGRRRTPITLPL